MFFWNWYKNRKRKNKLPKASAPLVSLNWKIDKEQQRLIEHIVEEQKILVDEARIQELKKYRRTYISAISAIILILISCLSLVGYYFYQTFF
ncbi:hypothetical protein [Mycoplasmopsis gallopavonis]|uniref:Uncharacterized protein n=1 Tax=Mycoplasmopsis gallopavonis TaxID=76629 RepID=A0A449B096_9BACT|nr:hypothetical protein [Mycoplasmopsis gallopavonis]RIV16843.1 hypothetical protein D1113_00680 [Mycoplasmopsis gallopavonis]VEU73147.1 Uncharacterised protein [Mycoplasmopsis gallopavonis]